MTTITDQEIESFRSQLADYPEGIKALDIIQECDGHLEDAIALITLRETGQEPERGLSDWLEKSRKIVCQEEFRNDLAGGLIGVLVEPLTTGLAIPPGIATVVAVYVFKIGVKRFCEPPNPTP
jgi:hypothetical protein